ncbi:MAG: hypothetical protein V1822_04295 [Candidatus Micrarchaeota archaeon]
MPVELRGNVLYSRHDFIREITKPIELGYYSEAISKIDAIIDGMLDGIIHKHYSDAKCAEFIWRLENATKTFKRGSLQAEILAQEDRQTGFPPVISRKLLEKIKNFKAKRNMILHSEIGHYSLVEKDIARFKGDNEGFQLSVKEAVLRTIDAGTVVMGELLDITAKK